MPLLLRAGGLLLHARRRRDELDLDRRELRVEALPRRARHVERRIGAHHHRVAVEQQVRAALDQDALEHGAERALDVLARLEEAALDQALPLLRLLLQARLLGLEILDLARLDVGREDRELLLQRFALRAQRRALALELALGLLGIG